MVAKAVQIELVTALGRWRSDAFNQYLKQPQIEKEAGAPKREGEAVRVQEERLSDDEEQVGAVTSGKWWDVCRPRKRVDPLRTSHELLCEF